MPTTKRSIIPNFTYDIFLSIIFFVT